MTDIQQYFWILSQQLKTYDSVLHAVMLQADTLWVKQSAPSAKDCHSRLLCSSTDNSAEVVGHVQSENGVHHFVTVDKYFLKTQSGHRQ